MGSTIFRVKNPGLYDTLKQLYGKVEVFAQGEDAICTMSHPSLLDPIQTPIVRKIEKGERYVVNCPFCGRDKLWISYLAGCNLRTDEGSISFSKVWVKCFRCRFQENDILFGKFWKSLEEGGYVDGRNIVVMKGVPRMPDNPDTVEAVAPLPITVPIDEANCPEVVEYLENRGLDYKELVKFSGCTWNPPSIIRSEIGRIIFPVWQNKILVGWQGRALDKDVSKTTPKYLFPSGVSKDRWIYNLDRARWCDYVVITEGVIDVFAVGPAGIGMFGKNVSTDKLKVICDIWGTKGVVLLPDVDDPDAMPLAIKYMNEWNARSLFSKGVHLCRLPEGKDPGDLRHQEIREVIKQQVGINIEERS